jgi:hypothetical protein
MLSAAECSISDTTRHEHGQNRKLAGRLSQMSPKQATPKYAEFDDWRPECRMFSCTIVQESVSRYLISSNVVVTPVKIHQAGFGMKVF